MTSSAFRLIQSKNIASYVLAYSLESVKKLK